MRRWGDGTASSSGSGPSGPRIRTPRFRSSFIVGYPGETEEDHDELLGFLDEAQLDWAGFFAFSPEEGTYAAGLPSTVPDGLVAERLRECGELQDAITARAPPGAGRHDRPRCSSTRPGCGRSHREAPEIDGIVPACPTAASRVPGGPVRRRSRSPGAAGPDLEAELV